MVTTIKKPQVVVHQQFAATTARTEGYLPTLLLGPRYNVKEYRSVAPYDYTTDTDYAYPGQELASVIDTDYTKLYVRQAILRYYSFGSDVWRKLGTSANKIRTILSTGLVFKTDAAGTYPHSGIFKDRGVKVGDVVKVGTVTTTVSGIEADKTTSSIESPIANSSNQAAQSNAISAVVAGQIGGTTMASNTADTYTGDLYKDVIADTYTVVVTQSGVAPVATVTDTLSNGITVAANAIYNYPASERYTVLVTTAGALGTAKYKVFSQSNTDNVTSEVTTPTTGNTSLVGSRGLILTWTAGTGDLVVNDTVIINVTPSQARLNITTASGSDQVLNRVFPGFAYEFAVGVRGLKITFTGTTMVQGFYWSVDCTKAVAAVVCNATGTYTGATDINYFLEVISGGVWGDAVIRNVNDSKLLTVLGAGSGYPVTVANGLQVYFTANTQGGLIAGDIFSVKCNSAQNTASTILALQDSVSLLADICTIGTATTPVGEPPATSGGTYTPSNTALEWFNSEIYSITISTGGALATAAFTVSTSSGLDDVSTPTVIAAFGAAYAVGTKGVTLSFATEGDGTFTVGSVYTVEVTKPDLEVKLYIPAAELPVPRQRTEDETQTAWEPKSDVITVNNDILLPDATWDLDDPLPVEVGQLYVTYRGLHTINAETVYTIPNLLLSTVDIVGEVHIDNPIAKGLEFALGTSTSYPIRVAYPAANTLAGWTTLLEKLEVRSGTEVYRICPMTDDPAILDAIKVHVNKTSAKNKWRDMYCARTIPAYSEVAVGTGTIHKNPSDPSKFVILRTADTNFVQAKVGDTVLFLGKPYIVKVINTPTELELTTGFVAEQLVSTPFSIRHVPTVQEQADLYVYYGNHFADRRVIHIAPDQFVYGGVTYPGYYLAAAVTGLKNNNVVHQSVTNYTLTGVTSVPKTLTMFTEEQLDQIATGGNLIVTQDSISEVPYIRHQLTTDVSDVKHREISIVENFDDLTYGVYNTVKPYIGKYNLHSGIVNQIRTDIDAYLFSKTASVTLSAGPQIIGYTIDKLAPNAEFEDQLDVEISFQLPPPLNYMDIKLTVK